MPAVLTSQALVALASSTVPETRVGEQTEQRAPV
jgi:hypothetical protein